MEVGCHQGERSRGVTFGNISLYQLSDLVFGMLWSIMQISSIRFKFYNLQQFYEKPLDQYCDFFCGVLCRIALPPYLADVSDHVTVSIIMADM